MSLSSYERIGSLTIRCRNNMAPLNSTSPASTMFHQSNALTNTASPSEAHLDQSAGGHPRGLTNGQSNGQSTDQTPLYIKNVRAGPQDRNELENGLVNGHAAGHASSSEPNNDLFEPQSIPRARTENHPTFPHRPNVSMKRSKTNYEPGNISPIMETNAEEHGELRHGWEDEYNSSEFLGHLNSVWLHISSVVSTEIWLANAFSRLSICTLTTIDMRVVETRKRARISNP